MSPKLLNTQQQLHAKTLPAKKGAKALKAQKKPKGWKKPSDKPKRPLSAYNLFFKYERDLMLRNIASPFGHCHEEHHSTLGIPPSVRKDRSKRVRPPPHGKIGFAQLAKLIGARWKSLSAEHRSHFEGLAKIEKERYNREVEEWQLKKDAKEAGVELPVEAGGAHAHAQAQALSAQQQLHHNETMYGLLKQAYDISANQEPQVPMPELPQVPTSVAMNGTNFCDIEAHSAATDCHVVPESSKISFVQPVVQKSSMDVQEHCWGQKFTEPKMINMTGEFSHKTTLKQTETSPMSIGFEDVDILDFLSRLVSE